MVPQGLEEIPVERYTSREWHDLEVSGMWEKVWQMACREEHIPKVGDYVVYEIGRRSIIVVRSEEHRIRAFHNVCLHRGATLVDDPAGQVDGGLRCPFHGFTWDLDGQLTFVPTPWDFPQVDPSRYGLPEVKVGTWGGWVFVNPDPGAAPLEEHLGGFCEAFPWRQEDLYLSAHVAKVHRCNWKVAMEAFLEALHVYSTHPEYRALLGDVNTQYDIFPGEPRWSRLITPSNVPSPILGDMPEQAVMDAAMSVTVGSGATFPLAPGQTARQVLAGYVQRGVQATLHSDEPISEAEAADSIQYLVFPNFLPWGGWSRLNYRFRPYENRCDRSLMEVLLLSAFPPGDRPPPAPMRVLGPDDSWTKATELGLYGPVFDQDSANLERLQRGLQASVKPGVTLANYQEARIRHYHHEIVRCIEAAATMPLNLP